VPLRETWTDVMLLEAATRDAVSVTINGAALTSVCDPDRYALAVAPPESATHDALEDEISRYVAERDLVELSGSAPDQHGELTSRVNAKTRAWGVEVARVELSRIEVRLDDDLIRWAEELSAQASPASALGGHRPGAARPPNRRRKRAGRPPYPRRSAVHRSG
jgi:regulator of protease activity HflC (stomatin/prohibitin superfamily)